MLKLYGQYRSRAFRVAWLLKESGIPYEHVNITIHTPEATAKSCLLYTSPSPRDVEESRMPSSA